MNEHDHTPPPIPSPSPNDWERQLISALAQSALVEQRRTRRWGIFFKCLTFAYLSIFLTMALSKHWGSDSTSSGLHTALIDIQGEVGSDPQASADAVVSGLRAAFKDSNTKGVILRINSPGGSAVHAGYIADEVFRLRSAHPAIPIYAVITDMCASGGYYIAVAANAIYADKASLVGSIGVAMNGFGFVGTLERLGVERRLVTAGAHKGFLDPFSPLNPQDLDHLKGVLGQVHRQFVDVVKKGRGDRLKEQPELFSGLIWSGEQGVALGLVDALGSSSYVAREVIKAETIVDFTQKQDYLDRFVERFSTTAAKALVGGIPAIR
ncbi:MAG: S49 family peptidase [Gammaproteobacteria bacterium]